MILQSSNNKRIAQNTIFLYIRMLLIMSVTLYTSRVILNTLGIEDYGIYGVVGGVVTMLSFLNASLSGASSRFITFAMGKGDKKHIQEVFSTVLCIHFLMMGFIILLGETVGLWFVYNKLVIPPERMTAALWVYHCSIFTAAISIISIPYNSLIISHERMGVFAYISIIEVLLKLIIVWVLIYIPQDKLIVYALLYLFVQLLIRIMYNYYCTTHFVESRTKAVWNISLMKQMSSYAGWTMNGNLAVIGYTQGLNILLNIFFGPAVNAARNISVQVQTAVFTFIQNFQMAVKPQIIKSYAISDLSYMHTLIVALSKYGFFLILLLAFPLMICVNPILKQWLGIVPEHTANFVCIMLFTGMLNSLGSALIIAIHATGDIKKFQLYEGTSLLTVVPIAYILVKFLHISPEIVMLVYLLVEAFTMCIRIWIVLPKISMKFSFYLQRVLLPIFPLIPCFIIPVYFISIPDNISWINLLIWITGSALYISLCIIIMGMNILERKKIYGFFIKKLYSLK